MVKTTRKKATEKASAADSAKAVGKVQFLRLTRLDGTSVWINSAFVVTVEPRKGGGAVVVPVGDGLDYDVKESPEVVVALLSGEPVPEPPAAPAPEAAPPPAPATPAKKASPVAAARKPSVAGLTEEELVRLRKMAPRTVKKLQNTLATQFKSADAAAAMSELEASGEFTVEGTRVKWIPRPEKEEVFAPGVDTEAESGEDMQI